MKKHMILLGLGGALLGWASAWPSGPSRSDVVQVPNSDRSLAGPPVWNGFCGNGRLDAREECDPGFPDLGIKPDLGGKTCETERYGGGILACTARCQLDRSGCSCAPGERLASVPKTGQTECWDELGAPIDCAGTGQDGELQRGVSASPRFTDNGDGTVTDNLSGLIWLRDSTCFGEATWAEALLAVRSLESGSCGLTDGSVAGAWRLPNINELQSLVASGPFYDPFSFFSGTVWSSTTYQYDPAGAWAASVPWGGLFGYYKRQPNRVWAVRVGQ